MWWQVDDDDTDFEWPDELFGLGVEADDAEGGTTSTTTSTTSTTEGTSPTESDEDYEDEQDAWPLELLLNS